MKYDVRYLCKADSENVPGLSEFRGFLQICIASSPARANMRSAALDNT